MIKMGRNQSRFKFVNTGLLSTVVHFQLKLVEIGQNIKVKFTRFEILPLLSRSIFLNVLVRSSSVIT